MHNNRAPIPSSSPSNEIRVISVTFLSCGAASQRGQRPPHSRRLKITHNTQSVGFLWTSDQLVAETSTWQHATLKIDRHPCPRRDSNPQSQQASGCRPCLRPRGHWDRLFLWLMKCRLLGRKLQKTREQLLLPDYFAWDLWLLYSGISKTVRCNWKRLLLRKYCRRKKVELCYCGLGGRVNVEISTEGPLSASILYWRSNRTLCLLVFLLLLLLRN
jgi:hypothetical protein